MSARENRELVIRDEEGGSTISLTRKGGVVTVDHFYLYTNHADEKIPLELGASDRIALIDFLNMGEYRRLSDEESR